MTNKRSRPPSNSTSYADITSLMAPPPLPDLPPLSTAFLSEPRQSNSSLFLASSSPPPRIERRDINEPFLERCFTCKKLLDHSKDIFLYSDSPFCSQECRNVQMAIDKGIEDAKNRAAKAKAANKGVKR